MKKFLPLFISVFVFASVCTVYSGGYDVYSPERAGDLIKNNSGENLLFIVDFSNSMNNVLNGEKKITSAVDILSDMVSRLGSNVRTGLRVYGHKFPFNEILACRASDLIVPLGAENNFKIANALSNVKALGQTPITYSLKSAINKDLADIPGEKRIILLTDGGENCDESPCEYAISVVSSRNDIKIDVIAFNLDDVEAQSQLRCTANVTGGKIYNAKTAGELAKSLENALNVTTDVQGTILRK